MEAVVAGTVSIGFLGGLPLGRGLSRAGGSCPMEAAVAGTVSIGFLGGLPVQATIFECRAYGMFFSLRTV